MGLELVHIERVVKKMDLYTEMLVEILSKQKMEIHFPELSFSVEELLEMRCDVMRRCGKSRLFWRMKA